MRHAADHTFSSVFQSTSWVLMNLLTPNMRLKAEHAVHSSNTQVWQYRDALRRKVDQTEELLS
jgi:hypothetical protein